MHGDMHGVHTVPSSPATSRHTSVAQTSYPVHAVVCMDYCERGCLAHHIPRGVYCLPMDWRSDKGPRLRYRALLRTLRDICMVGIKVYVHACHSVISKTTYVH